MRHLGPHLGLYGDYVRLRHRRRVKFHPSARENDRSGTQRVQLQWSRRRIIEYVLYESSGLECQGHVGLVLGEYRSFVPDVGALTNRPGHVSSRLCGRTFVCLK